MRRLSLTVFVLTILIKSSLAQETTYPWEILELPRTIQFALLDPEVREVLLRETSSLGIRHPAVFSYDQRTTTFDEVEINLIISEQYPERDPLFVDLKVRVKRLPNPDAVDLVISNVRIASSGRVEFGCRLAELDTLLAPEVTAILLDSQFGPEFRKVVEASPERKVTLTSILRYTLSGSEVEAGLRVGYKFNFVDTVTGNELPALTVYLPIITSETGSVIARVIKNNVDEPSTPPTVLRALEMEVARERPRERVLDSKLMQRIEDRAEEFGRKYVNSIRVRRSTSPERAFPQVARKLGWDEPTIRALLRDQDFIDALFREQTMDGPNGYPPRLIMKEFRRIALEALRRNAR